MVNSKHAFWQALVFAVVIFILGMVLGFFLEKDRASEIELNLVVSELNLLDEQLRNQISDSLDVECDLAIESTFNFADKIYWEAAKMEKYDAASKFSNDLRIIHRRYDLLRTMLWIEAIDLIDRCDSDIHIVVYFYQYDVEDIDVKAKQLFFSRLLLDAKSENPDDILLIPIAGNLDLESVNLALENYDLPELPIILIDEERIVDEVVTLDELKKTIFESIDNQ